MNKKIDQLTDRKAELTIQHQDNSITTNVIAPVSITNSTSTVNAPVININLNSYREPDTSSIKLTVDELLKSDGNFWIVLQIGK